MGRLTGRTTRSLKEAADAALSGAVVYYICPHQQHIPHCIHIATDALGGKRRSRDEVEFGPGLVRCVTFDHRPHGISTRRNVEIVVDHAAWPRERSHSAQWWEQKYRPWWETMKRIDARKIMIWTSGPYQDSAEAKTPIGTYKIIRVHATFRAVLNGVVVYVGGRHINEAKQAAERHFAARPE